MAYGGGAPGAAIPDPMAGMSIAPSAAQIGAIGTGNNWGDISALVNDAVNHAAMLHQRDRASVNAMFNQYLNMGMDAGTAAQLTANQHGTTDVSHLLQGVDPGTLSGKYAQASQNEADKTSLAQERMKMLLTIAQSKVDEQTKTKVLGLLPNFSTVDEFNQFAGPLLGTGGAPASRQAPAAPSLSAPPVGLRMGTGQQNTPSAAPTPPASSGGAPAIPTLTGAAPPPPAPIPISSPAARGKMDLYRAQGPERLLKGATAISGQTGADIGSSANTANALLNTPSGQAPVLPQGPAGLNPKSQLVQEKLTDQAQRYLDNSKRQWATLTEKQRSDRAREANQLFGIKEADFRAQLAQSGANARNANTVSGSMARARLTTGAAADRQSKALGSMGDTSAYLKLLHQQLAKAIAAGPKTQPNPQPNKPPIPLETQKQYEDRIQRIRDEITSITKPPAAPKPHKGPPRPLPTGGNRPATLGATSGLTVKPPPGAAPLPKGFHSHNEYKKPPKTFQQAL